LIDEGASRATIVLLPKQVHLQKDVGAEWVSWLSNDVGTPDLQAASDIDRKLKNVMSSRR
jgi:hypothetical protein